MNLLIRNCLIWSQKIWNCKNHFWYHPARRGARLCLNVPTEKNVAQWRSKIKSCSNSMVFWLNFTFIMHYFITDFQAYNKTYAAIATASSFGSDCKSPLMVHEYTMNMSCARCKPSALQCPHGLFCFLLENFYGFGVNGWKSLCRYIHVLHK